MNVLSRSHLLVSVALLGAWPLVAVAQAQLAATPQQEVDTEETEIVVTGQRERGVVAGDINPELQLGPADIRARGVSSVADLLADLAPQLRSGRGDGPPVVLLEGRRISGFREVANLPAEAIARVDILPEEVALKYGYPGDQRVVNIVLRKRFRAITVELEDRVATRGGANNIEGTFDFLRIQRGGRLSINAQREATAALFESQRGIDDGSGSGQYRMLLPRQQAFTAAAVWNRTIFETVNATISGELKTDDSVANFGLPGAALLVPGGSRFAAGSTDIIVNRRYADLSPLARDSGSQTASAGLTLNGDVSGWRWTLTGTYDHVDSKSFVGRGIDPALLQAAILAGDPRADPFGPILPQYLTLRPDDRATTVSDLGALDFTVSGSPFALPAGDVSTTLRVGSSFSVFGSSSVRSGITQSGRVSRDIADGQLNIDVPIASRRRAALDAIGDLSLNANYAHRRLSDYGSLRTLGYGFNWSPIKAITLIASVTQDEVAPSAPQIGNPVIANPDVRVFDFVRGETAFVTQISGGNPALTPSDRSVFKLGGSVKPFGETDLTLTADFVTTRVRGGIASLPPATLASQTAFPDRYIRDGRGVLIRVDTRAVNFAQADRSEIRWGINFSRPLKTSQAQVDALRAAFQSRFPNGPPRRPDGAGPGQGAGAGGGGRGGGFGGGRGGGGGRLNFGLYHTLHLTDRVTLREGQPVIDLLRGGTIGSGGGQSRHEIELQAGASKNGWGARLTGNWRSATRTADLRFSDLGTANLRLFVNLAQQPAIIRSVPWLAGTRVTIGINNIFDTRQRVTDATGATPLSYLPAYLDPLGRTVRISIRKLLF